MTLDALSSDVGHTDMQSNWWQKPAPPSEATMPDGWWIGIGAILGAVMWVGIWEAVKWLM